jgi:hypothetical protein
MTGVEKFAGEPDPTSGTAGTSAAGPATLPDPGVMLVADTGRDGASKIDLIMLETSVATSTVSRTPACTIGLNARTLASTSSAACRTARVGRPRGRVQLFNQTAERLSGIRKPRCGRPSVSDRRGPHRTRSVARGPAARTAVSGDAAHTAAGVADSTTTSRCDEVGRVWSHRRVRHQSAIGHGGADPPPRQAGGARALHRASRTRSATGRGITAGISTSASAWTGRTASTSTSSSPRSTHELHHRDLFRPAGCRCCSSPTPTWRRCSTAACACSSAFRRASSALRSSRRGQPAAASTLTASSRCC